jgi:hypothetical protein
MARRQLLNCGLLLGAMTGLGFGIYCLAPPQPRWCLTGFHSVDLTMADQSWIITSYGTGHITGGPAILRDLGSGEPLQSYFSDTGHHGWTMCSPDGKWIARFEAGQLRVAAVSDGAEHSIPFDRDNFPGWFSYSQNGEVIALDLYCPRAAPGQVRGHRVVLVETATGQRLAEFRGKLAHTVTALGGSLFLLLTGPESPMLKAWDVHDRRWAFQIDEPITIAGVSPDGKTLISQYRDPDIGTRGWALWDLERGIATHRSPHGGRLESHHFSADGRRVAIQHARGRERQIEVWDLDANHCLLHMQGDELGASALSPDGRRLAVQTIARGDDPVISVAILDISTGRRLHQQRAAASMFWSEPGPVFTPDGQSIVVYRANPHRAEFYDTENGNALTTLPLEDAAGVWCDASLPATRNPKVHVVDQQFAAFPGAWWHDYVPEFILSREGVREVVVIDVEGRRVRGRMRLADEHVYVLDGGRLMLTVAPESPDGTRPGHVCCWDVPPGAPWVWVIGIPAALGMVIATLARWRRLL